MTTPDCCHEWALVMGVFDWMVIEGEHDKRVMPHIQTQVGKLRVNYCPVCGANRRGCVVPKESVYDSRAMLTAELPIPAPQTVEAKVEEPNG